jgi:hypothetical protein
MEATHTMTFRNLYESTHSPQLSLRLSVIVQSIQDSYDPSTAHDVMDAFVDQLKKAQFDVLRIDHQDSHRDTHEVAKFAVSVGLAASATIRDSDFKVRLYHFECVSRLNDVGYPMAYLSVYIVAKNMKVVQDLFDPIFKRFDTPKNGLRERQEYVSKRNA